MEKQNNIQTKSLIRTSIPAEHRIKQSKQAYTAMAYTQFFTATTNDYVSKFAGISNGSQNLETRHHQNSIKLPVSELQNFWPKLLLFFFLASVRVCVMVVDEARRWGEDEEDENIGGHFLILYCALAFSSRSSSLLLGQLFVLSFL